MTKSKIAHMDQMPPPIFFLKSRQPWGHISQLTDQLFSDLNIEHQNQQHIHASQHRDVELLVKYFVKENIFDFESDAPSEHEQWSIYIDPGCIRLAGRNNTGHSNHLKRHILRLRVRHAGPNIDKLESPLDTELARACDSRPINFTIQEEGDEFEEMSNELMYGSEDGRIVK